MIVNVQASFTIVAYDRQNIFIIQATGVEVGKTISILFILFLSIFDGMHHELREKSFNGRKKQKKNFFSRSVHFSPVLLTTLIWRRKCVRT
jgi:hypothetical protein